MDGRYTELILSSFLMTIGHLPLGQNSLYVAFLSFSVVGNSLVSKTGLAFFGLSIPYFLARAARCACLRPVACAPSRWTACPPLRLHPVSSPAPAVRAALMVYPPPRLACQGLSRHSLVRCAACVIPRSPGTRRGSGQPGLTATNRRRRADPPVIACSRSSRRGGVRCAATLEKRSCPLPPVHSEQAQGQARKAGFIVQ